MRAGKKNLSNLREKGGKGLEVSGEWLEKSDMPWVFRDDANHALESGNPFVVNLDSKGGEGTHWTAAYLQLPQRTLYYADPFGTLLNGWPPRELADRADKQVVNRIAWQHPSTDLCGYYAYLFAKAMREIGDTHYSVKEFEELLRDSLVG